MFQAQAVIDTLQKITHEQVKPLLDEKHTVDSSVGIIIVGLPGDIEHKGMSYHFHAARILPKSFVNPHYHVKGVEPYHILFGKGEMNLGTIVSGEVIWKGPRIVAVGEVVEVQENEVHSLRNIGEEPLDFTFACPDEHLVDHSSEHPEGDRYLTKDLSQGKPPQYPV